VTTIISFYYYLLKELEDRFFMLWYILHIPESLVNFVDVYHLMWVNRS